MGQQLRQTLIGGGLIVLSCFYANDPRHDWTFFSQLFIGMAMIPQAVAISLEAMTLYQFKSVRPGVVAGQLIIKSEYSMAINAGRLLGFAITLLIIQIFMNSAYVWGGIIMLTATGVGYLRLASGYPPKVIA